MAPELFQVVTPTDALARLSAHITSTKPSPERVAIEQAIGRITITQIISKEQSPSFPRSAMDGYAVRAIDTYGASAGLPSYLQSDGEVPMGASDLEPISPASARLIHTGGMIPPNADAVVMVEHTQIIDKHAIEVIRPVAPGENIIRAGEDISPGDVVLPKGHRIRAQDAGALAALGISEIEVAARPILGVVSSGDELVAPDKKPLAGQVRDVNSTTLLSLARNSGANAQAFGIAPDNFEGLRKRAHQALDSCDIVAISAGSSVSTRDLTAEVINSLGNPGVLTHGLTVKPGKPTIVAAANGKPIFGLPGNPVSAIVVFGLVVEPTIRQLLGASNAETRPQLRARLARNLPSETGRMDFVPATLVHRAGDWWAQPILGKSNLIFTVVQASGLIQIPLNAGGVEEGSWVDVELL